MASWAFCKHAYFSHFKNIAPTYSFVSNANDIFDFFFSSLPMPSRNPRTISQGACTISSTKHATPSCLAARQLVPCPHERPQKNINSKSCFEQLSSWCGRLDLARHRGSMAQYLRRHRDWDARLQRPRPEETHTARSATHVVFPRV